MYASNEFSLFWSLIQVIIFFALVSVFIVVFCKMIYFIGFYLKNGFCPPSLPKKHDRLPTSQFIPKEKIYLTGDEREEIIRKVRSKFSMKYKNNIITYSPSEDHYDNMTIIRPHNEEIKRNEDRAVDEALEQALKKKREIKKTFLEKLFYSLMRDYSKIGATLVSTSSIISCGTLSSLLPFRAFRSSARG